MEVYLREVGYTPHLEALDELAETIRRFVKNCLFNDKYIETKVVSIDEPSFGYNNIEASSDVICGVLEKAFDFNGATREIHLHSTAGFSDLLAVRNSTSLASPTPGRPPEKASGWATAKYMHEELDDKNGNGFAVDAGMFIRCDWWIRWR